MSEKRTSPLTYLIVSGMFVLALAAILVFGLGGSGTIGSSSGSAISSEKKKEPPRDLTAGEKITRSEVEGQGVALAESPKPVDTNRITAAYKQGKTYRINVKAEIDSRGSYKDWGITADMNTKFIGEFEILRDIERNDGDHLVVLQEFTKVEFLQLFTQVDSISAGIGNAAHTAIDIAGSFVDIPPGSSRIAIGAINKILASEAVRNSMAEVVQDEAAQLFVNIDSLNGKRCRITYENGVGVTNLESVGCTLSSEEYSFIMDSAVLSDIYLMPDEECKEGDTWEVRGEDFLPILDPSMRASVSGILTARRGKDGGDSNAPTATLRLESGVLDLRGRDTSTEVAASWAPRGELVYSFRDQVFTSGRLGGDLSIKANSLDHVLFEMRNVVTPKYGVTYHCEVLE